MYPADGASSYSGGASTSPQECVRHAKDLYERHESWWRATVWEKIQRRREFWLGDRYENDNGAYEKDRRLLQIRGQESSDEARHIVAKVTEKPRSVEARPRDKIDDPDAAEAAVSVTEWALSNPYSGFDTPFERALLAAREEAIGIVWMDYDPDDSIHQYKYRYVPGDRMMWDPAFWEDPHHPDCEWLIEMRRVDTAQARKDYKAPWLISDWDCTQMRSGQPSRNYSGSYGPQSYDDKKTTLWLCWYKNDGTEKPEPEVRDETPLPPEDQYLSCAAGCGYRSKTQGEQQAAGEIEGELDASLENEMMGGCPGMDGQPCGGELTKIEVTETADYVRAYEQGRRLVVIAPNNPEDKPLADDSWPIPTQRSFPAFFITPYIKPGWSDAEEHWDQQLAADQLRTLAIQRVFEHRNINLIPSVGINDANGKRYVFRENQGNNAFIDRSELGMGPLNIEQLNGTGLDPSWPIVMQSTLQSLTQFTSRADFGSSEESTRDIAVGTTQELVKQAEIPTAHFKRRINRELGKFYGPVYDTVQATLTPEMAARLRIDGMDIVVNMAGDAMPNFDFVIEDTPEFTGLDEAKQKAFDSIMQMILNPMTAPYVPIFAEIHNLPRSVVRRFEKIQQQQQEEAMMMEQEAAAMGIEPGAGMGPEGAGEDLGPIGDAPGNEMGAAGMVPGAVA